MRRGYNVVVIDDGAGAKSVAKFDVGDPGPRVFHHRLAADDFLGAVYKGVAHAPGALSDQLIRVGQGGSRGLWRGCFA